MIIEVKNSDNKLVATIDGDTQTITIVRRGCETRVRFCAGGVEITNEKANLKKQV